MTLESIGEVPLAKTDAVRFCSTRMHLFGIPVDGFGSTDQLTAKIYNQLHARRRFLVTFINPSSVSLSRRSQTYLPLLQRFDAVLPDGNGIVLAIKHLLGHSIQRASFDSTSLALPVFKMVQQMERTVAFIGGEDGVAERAAAQIRERFPDLRIVAALNGYGDFHEKIQKIRTVNPDVVVCGMGADVQELFLLELSRFGWQGCGFTCGGYLDQLSKGIQYYPNWIDRLNLRFAYRLFREPKRLWRRYFISYSFFLKLYLNSARKRVFRSKERAMNIH